MRSTTMPARLVSTATSSAIAATRRNAMKPRCAVLVAVLLATCASVAAPPAHAVPCGHVDPSTKEKTKAALTFDDKASRTAISFRRKTKTRNLTLVFNVSGCQLDGRPDPAPQLKFLPKQGAAEDLPEEAVEVKPADADDSTLYLTGSVDPNKLDPGMYEGIALARAPWLTTARTPIAVSRSEHRWLIPLLIGALAGLAGVLWFLAMRYAVGDKMKTLSRWRIALVVLLPVVAGAFAVLASYWDQEVWSVSDNLPAALIAGFTGATTGSMAAVLAAIKDKGE